MCYFVSQFVIYTWTPFYILVLELPGLVATMKTVLDNISKSPGSSVCSSSPSHSDSQRTGSDTGSDDLVWLKDLHCNRTPLLLFYNKVITAYQWNCVFTPLKPRQCLPHISIQMCTQGVLENTFCTTWVYSKCKWYAKLGITAKLQIWFVGIRNALALQLYYITSVFETKHSSSFDGSVFVIYLVLICLFVFSQMFLGNSAVQVSKRLYQRISSRRMSLFTQDLATLIFGKDTLAKSTLTGKGKKGEVKDQLDPEKINAIIGTDNQY